MNVTEVPEQTGLADGATETLTGSKGFTVIVTGAEVAGLPVIQLAFEVRAQITISLLVGLYEKDGLLVPLIVPFTFH